MKMPSLMSALVVIVSIAGAGTAFAGDQAAGKQQQTKAYTKVSSDFKSMDSNGDNMISRDEASKTSVIGYFTAIDQNSDHNISKDEYNQFLKSYPSLVEEDQMEEAE